MPRHLPVLTLGLLLLLSRTATSTPSVENREFTGTGRAVLGSGMTLEDAEYIAQRLAQRDAVEQFGVEVLAKTDLLRSEGQGKSASLSQEEITTLAAGKAKLLPGTKTVSREMQGEFVVVSVKATFLIEDSDFASVLGTYGASRDQYKDVMDRLRSLEHQLDGYASGSFDAPVASFRRAETTARSELNNLLALNGRAVVAELSQRQSKDIGTVLSSVRDAIELSCPSKLLTVRLDGPLGGRLDDGGTVLSFRLQVKVDRGRIVRMRDLRRRSQQSFARLGMDKRTPLANQFDVALVMYNGQQEIIGVSEIIHAYMVRLCEFNEIDDLDLYASIAYACTCEVNVQGTIVDQVANVEAVVISRKAAFGDGNSSGGDGQPGLPVWQGLSYESAVAGEAGLVFPKENMSLAERMSGGTRPDPHVIVDMFEVEPGSMRREELALSDDSYRNSMNAAFTGWLEGWVANGNGRHE